MKPEGMVRLSSPSPTMSSATSRASTMVFARPDSRLSSGAKGDRSLNIVPKRASRPRPKTATTSEPRGSPTACFHFTAPGSARPSAPTPLGRPTTGGRAGGDRGGAAGGGVGGGGGAAAAGAGGAPAAPPPPAPLPPPRGRRRGHTPPPPPPG